MSGYQDLNPEIFENFLKFRNIKFCDEKAMGTKSVQKRKLHLLMKIIITRENQILWPCR